MATSTASMATTDLGGRTEEGEGGLAGVPGDAAGTGGGRRGGARAGPAAAPAGRGRPPLAGRPAHRGAAGLRRRCWRWVGQSLVAAGHERLWAALYAAASWPRAPSTCRGRKRSSSSGTTSPSRPSRRTGPAAGRQASLMGPVGPKMGRLKARSWRSWTAPSSGWGRPCGRPGRSPSGCSHQPRRRPPRAPGVADVGGGIRGLVVVLRAPQTLAVRTLLISRVSKTARFADLGAAPIALATRARVGLA